MVVAPLEADCWYGISTPCSMVASFWFAVMTRGEEMMFAAVFGLRGRQLEVDDVVGAEEPSARRAGRVARPAG